MLTLLSGALQTVLSLAMNELSKTSLLGSHR